LALDDFIIRAVLHECVGASDLAVTELSSRLLNRRLYKAIDVTALKNRGGEASVARFRAELGELQKSLDPVDVLEDQGSRNPYERRGYESPDALKKVLIRRAASTFLKRLASGMVSTSSITITDLTVKNSPLPPVMLRR
jgi:uncharacterized protein